MHPSWCNSLDQKAAFEAELSVTPTYPPLVYIVELSQHFTEFLLDENEPEDETEPKDMLQERS